MQEKKNRQLPILDIKTYSDTKGLVSTVKFPIDWLNVSLKVGQLVCFLILKFLSKPARIKSFIEIEEPNKVSRILKRN